MPVVLNAVAGSTDALVTQSVVVSALPNLSQSQIAFVPIAIEAATKAIRFYTGRDFILQNYDEIHVLHQDGRIMLKKFPVNIVNRVAGGRAPALIVANKLSTTNQRATIGFSYVGDASNGLTYTGVVLTSVASAVVTTTPLTFAAYPTIASLAAAINAVGNGWTATVESGMGQWPTTEFVGGESAQGCLSGPGAYLYVFAQDYSTVSVDQPTGVIRLQSSLQSGGQAGLGGYYGDFLGGAFAGEDVIANLSGRQIRVQYVAGYGTVPADVQQACVFAVRNILNFNSQDLSILRESVGQHMIEQSLAPKVLSKDVKQLLFTYKDFQV